MVHDAVDHRGGDGLAAEDAAPAAGLHRELGQRQWRIRGRCLEGRGRTFLLPDDPVQSMNDANVLGFADL